MDTEESHVAIDQDERLERTRRAVAASGQVLASLRALQDARRAGVAPGLAPADLVIDLVEPSRHLSVVPGSLSP